MKNAKNSPMGCWQRLKSIEYFEKCIKVCESVLESVKSALNDFFFCGLIEGVNYY